MTSQLQLHDQHTTCYKTYKIESINQSIYLFVLCFKTKNTPLYVKKSFRKHRKAAK